MDSISSAVQSAYGGRPVVQCSREVSSGRSGRELLTSIAVCADASLSIIDCPSNIISKEGCHSDRLYFLPF